MLPFRPVGPVLHARTSICIESRRAVLEVPELMPAKRQFTTFRRESDAFQCEATPFGTKRAVQPKVCCT
eukprot:8586-Alexandrium_andersonii.AAC.1